MKSCRQCNQPIPPTRQANAVFCSFRCYKKDNKRRWRGRFGKEPNWKSIIIEILGGMCTKCGSQKDLQLDHVVALSDGGTHTAHNIQPLCRTHYIEKSTYEAIRRASPLSTVTD